MKTTFPSSTPFTVPDEALAAREQAIYTATSEGFLANPSLKQVPFTVNEGFFDRQYAQILERKASPTPWQRWAPVLRPAMVSATALCMIAAFMLQPSTPSPIQSPDSVWVSDALSTTNNSDTQLLLDEQSTPSTHTLDADLSEDEEYVF